MIIANQTPGSRGVNTRLRFGDEKDDIKKELKGFGTDENIDVYIETIKKQNKGSLDGVKNIIKSVKNLGYIEFLKDSIKNKKW